MEVASEPKNFDIFYIFYNLFRNNTPIALFILRCEVKNYIQVRILYK